MWMKALIFLVFLGVPFHWAAAIEYTQKDRDILIEIRAKMHEIDKRFEQIDKRFDQVDKRLEFHQSLFYLLFAAVIGSPFLVELLARRREKDDSKSIEEGKRAVIALRELAQKDAKVAAALRVAGLL